MIYDQTENESLSTNIESVQYNASLAITKAIRGTCQEKPYQELVLGSLRSRRWLRHMCYFYKLIKTQNSLYLFNLIPPRLSSLHHPNTYTVMRFMRCRNDYFKKKWYLVVTEWNELSTELKFAIQLLANNLGNHFYLSFNQPVGAKLLFRLRLGFSYLWKHKFRYNFYHNLNPLCSWSLLSETTSHYKLHKTSPLPQLLFCSFSFSEWF